VYLLSWCPTYLVQAMCVLILAFSKERYGFLHGVLLNVCFLYVQFSISYILTHMMSFICISYCSPPHVAQFCSVCWCNTRHKFLYLRHPQAVASPFQSTPVIRCKSFPAMELSHCWSFQSAEKLLVMRSGAEGGVVCNMWPCILLN
jgi:hypothetical protein